MAQARSSRNNIGKPTPQQAIHELKQRTIVAINKLSDRDTYQIAAQELQGVAVSLSPEFLSPFLTCLCDTDSRQKSIVRKECVKLFATLADAHGDFLTSHLSKMVASIVRRLKDPDSNVRDACVDAVGVMASKITTPSIAVFIRPLFECLGEQNRNLQVGSAMCLARAIDNAADPQPAGLQRLLPRIVKLLNNQIFLGKPALLCVIGSIVEARGASNQHTLSMLIPAMEDALRSTDWATRKAAAEAFSRMALSIADLITPFKSSCLASLESCRFDKVKPVRDMANQALQSWKSIPDSDEYLPSPEIESSAKENMFEDRFSVACKTSNSSKLDFGSVKKNNIAVSRSPPDTVSVSSIRKRSPLTDKKTNPALLHKQGQKKCKGEAGTEAAAPPPEAEPEAVAYMACPHLEEYRSMQGLRGFRVVQKCLWQSGCSPGRWSVKGEPAHVPICSVCGEGGRLYACLVCAIISCNTHLRLHSQKKASHTIAVDLDRAELYCSGCNDQVYDPDFDRLVLLSSPHHHHHHHHHDDGDDKGKRNSVVTWGRQKRRKIAEYKAWVAGPNEKTLMRQRATRLNCEGEGEGERWPWGLRGLNNLGNSCFMNCVLQTLLHTPPLRNYFLSDRHNRAFCHNNKNGCITCDMDDIFSASFSGDRTPYSPARFLYSWWQHAANFAGYEQQDAHDFFISTVDGIHANHAISSPKSRLSQKQQCNASAVECRCIVHKVFSGVLRSDVICTVCNSTSTTYDPCLDISLDLEPSTAPLSNLADLSSGNLRGDLFKKGHLTGTSTLLGCLDRFTRPERLGSNEKFYCRHCQTRQESIKQMSVKKLPLVLCFHIKRFEHSTTQHTSKKVDRYMQFPFSLDMAPYMSSSIVRLRYGNRILAVEPNVGMPAVSGKTPSVFDLFAVVTHSGRMDSGHYVAFLRRGENWYKCDDAWVNQVSEQAVRASQGYMLYYVQKTFHYGTSVDQSLT